MKKLIMCQGLPGSGKTTWAVNQVATLNEAQAIDNLDITYSPAGVRVNKDDIRAELETTGWQWSHQNEQYVIDTRDLRIVAAFTSGAQVVISDDTNLDRKHRARLAELARECGATFEVKKFTTSVDECVCRDFPRSGKAHVGEKVIRNMAARYHWPPPVPDYSTISPVIVTEGLMPAVICDLDGTLALMGHRSPYDASTCGQDAVNPAVRTIIRACHDKFMQIIYLSGREAIYQRQTSEWLDRHACPPGRLYMRAAGDHRKDWIVKSELFDQHVRGKYDVLFVLDDRNQVVDMWRAIGLTCLQAAPGDF